MTTNDPFIQSIVDCAYVMAKELGSGFSSEVYANALAVELRKAKWGVVQKQDLDIFYNGVCVGTSQADLIVEERVIISVGNGAGIDGTKVDQCRNDMKAACLVAGLIFDFGYSRMEVRQVGVISEEGVEHWVTDVIEIV